MITIKQCGMCLQKRIIQDGAYTRHTDMKTGAMCEGSYYSWQETINLAHERLRNERLDRDIDRNSPTLVGLQSPESRKFVR